MNGWLIFLIMTLVLGVILSDLILLKQIEKLKIPRHILKSIEERKRLEKLKAEKLEAENKKPADD